MFTPGRTASGVDPATLMWAVGKWPFTLDTTGSKSRRGRQFEFRLLFPLVIPRVRPPIWCHSSVMRRRLPVPMPLRPWRFPTPNCTDRKHREGVRCVRSRSSLEWHSVIVIHQTWGATLVPTYQ
jgi:hypothetical protein